MAHKLGFEVHELSYKWNHMTMFSEPWNGNADRFESYIVHYAGQGIFDAGGRQQQIQNDAEKVYKSDLKFLIDSYWTNNG